VINRVESLCIYIEQFAKTDRHARLVCDSTADVERVPIINYIYTRSLHPKWCLPFMTVHSVQCLCLCNVQVTYTARVKCCTEITYYFNRRDNV